MGRCCFLALALLLAACASSPAAPAFPPVVAGVWKLKSVERFDASQAPEMVRRIGTRGWWSATYEGAGSATVEMYALPGPAAGLEMVQEWRPMADSGVWYTPHYFVVVRWKSAERAAVGAMIRELEKQFAERQ
jgi:hypothetical protein